MSRKLLMAAVASLVLGACSEDASSPVPQINTTRSLESGTSQDSSHYVITAEQKITALQRKMQEARKQSLDVTREETVLWFANEFLKYASWDEANQEAVAYAFAQYAPYAERSEQLAADIPDFQRQKVIEILDAATAELDQVITGTITRRPVPKVDWQNIEVGDNMLLSDGKPIFLYDYFSKSVGRPLTDTAVYNDHLGAIYHGGENLYPVDHDRAINSFLLKEDGTFDEALLSEVTGIDNSNVGFLIYWNMGIPEWVEAREPEVRKGRSLFTGYDIDNPLVRDVWGTIAKETGALTRDKKVTQLGYILANEPHWYSEAGHWSQNFQEMNEISSYTLTHFREWLHEKYAGEIAPLNTNWKTEFASFDEVSIDIPINPETRGTPIWYDWSRFNMDRSINWFSFLQSKLKEGNPSADTHIKIMPNMYSENNRSHGIDVEALTELTTMIGDDAKARESRLLNHKNPEKWEAHYSLFWEEMSMSYDFMESVSPEKIHVNSESHFLSASWWRDLDTSVDYVHAIYWLATLQGMDANMAWFWARDPDGSFEDRLEGELNFFDPALAGSFAGSVNQQPHIANAFTQVMYDLNSFSQEIIQLRKQRRPLRLFHSETSAINKPFHMSEQFDVYEKLFFEGFPMGFATQKIIQKQDNNSWDAVLVYKTEFVTRAELEALQQYLDNGGTVIVDSPESLSKDEYGLPHSVALKGPKERLVQLSGDATLEDIRELALDTVKESLPRVKLRESNGTGHKGVRWQAIAQQDGRYLISAINLGKNDATLTLNVEGGGELNVVDMLTQKPVSVTPVLAPKSVVLWQVRVGQ
ncbi:beta-galactosidase [Gilvimarinus agarilyticus]|uniref:alpha-amylase family protein n=1 Tax=Gilvimarinus sp. 2_MG-2023 TaxID=3062666 RepID=UPI001C092EDF|nr:alpha-amylase family protein [Gilvimarinus sp. 2_MG-2023]MBU2886357.1 beta-galactosidase [Gilvimarinus agarilyticus]MDO6571036.1 beta-galactosidase [Gilvimarinus sp. 2_MG-2023]